MEKLYDTPRQWADAISLFGAAQRASKLAESTIKQRVKHIQRLAAAADLGPWEQSYESLSRWLQTVPEGFTRASHQTSVRAFYRWACTAGRVFNDPSRPPTYVTRRLPVPLPWQRPIADYQTFMRSLGRIESTVGARSSQLARFAREHPSLGPWEVSLDDMVRWLGGKRWSPEMRRAHRGALRNFYTWAVETERTTENPAAKLPVVKRGHHMPRPVIDDDYRLALAKAEPRERLAVRLAAELGLRAGEVVKVHSRDLLQRGEHWSLLVHGKGNRDRVIPLPEQLHGILRAQPEGYLFPGQIDGHMSSHYMSKLISALLPQGVTMHALRHRFATRAYSVNRDVFAVQQLLGHASPQTTQQYVQIADYDLRRLVETVSA